MSVTHEILDPSDFDSFVKKIKLHFTNHGFCKLNIVCKRWRKPKTSAQLRKYWSLIGALQKLYTEAGYRISVSDCHQFVKAKSGFTKIVDGVIFTKSISDLSDDASVTALSNLIEFIIEFASINFDTDLESLNNEVVG